MYRMAMCMGMLLLAGVWAAGQETPAPGCTVVVCPIDGMIEDGVTVVVERAIREAQGAEAIVFVIDTPGGLVDSALDITTAILEAPCRTIAFIKGMGAISAGAMISFSCDDIIMTPDTNIGAATPVIMSAEGMQPTSEKEVSFMRAKMRALAERKKHNPAIAEAMVDKDLALRAYEDAEGRLTVVRAVPETASDSDADRASDIARNVTDAIDKAVEALPPELGGIKDAIKNALPASETPAAPEPAAQPMPGREDFDVPSGFAAGKLLTLTPMEAVKYGLVPTTANNLDETMAFYGLADCRKIEIAPSLAERIFRFLSNPMVAGLLLLLGLGGMYMEAKTPGFGIFGITGIVCLCLFFGAQYVIGLAEMMDLILVVIGIALIAFEVFIFPGFGLAGVTGMMCLFFGLYLSLTRVTFPEYSWDYQRIEDAGLSALIASVGFAVFLYLFWKVFPRTPMFNWLVLSYAQSVDAGYVVQTAEQERSAIGLEGEASSFLRPAGRGRFGDKTYSVVSRGDFIERGRRIVIVRVEGNRYVVEEIPDKEEETAR